MQTSCLQVAKAGYGYYSAQQEKKQQKVEMEDAIQRAVQQAQSKPSSPTASDIEATVRLC